MLGDINLYVYLIPLIKGRNFDGDSLYRLQINGAIQKVCDMIAALA